MDDGKTVTPGAHVPVMLTEVLGVLEVGASDVYVDATIGMGGHASAILEGLGPDGRVIGVDRDADMLKAAQQRLKADDRVRLYQATFDQMDEVLRQAGVSGADAMLADLGVSSPQIDAAGRGFSFRMDGPLDMRMDQSGGPTAAEILARTGAEELGRIFFEYGEERHARRIARAIVRERKRRAIETTTQLAELVADAVPGRGRIHPATRVFQALRIEVNEELAILERFLQVAPSCLAPGGRLAVISFHSLEDRRVKQAFRDLGRSDQYEVLTRKVVRPGRAEELANRRSRSARMRAIRRVA